MSQTQDPIQPWFEALEAMGEYSGIRFGKVNEETNSVEWLDMPHTHYDGIGGFAKILGDRGGKVEDLPRIPHSSKESWWPLIKSLPMMLAPRHRLRMKVTGGSENVEDYKKPSEALAWHVFSEEETAQIRKAGRLLQISINSLLLRHLDRAIRYSLEDPSAQVTWMVPVNLRGKINSEDITSNHSSYVSVSLKASETPLGVHREIYRKLEKGEHWANWKSYKLGKFLSEQNKQKIIKNDRGTLKWNIGSFSNLGIWDKHGKIVDEDSKGPWVFAPPVLEGVRIGAGCVTFQNRLSLMIQAHPALTTNPEVLQEWLKEWVSQIKIDTTSLHPD